MKTDISKILFLSFGLAFLLNACQITEQVKTKSETNLYFDLGKFADEQIKFLETASPKVKKELVIDDETDSFSSEEVNWEEELSMLKDMNFNKPFFKGSYNVSKDEKQDGYVEKYLATGKEKVRSLELDYQNNQLSKLNVLAEEGNLLFTISKRFESVMDSTGKMTHYTITVNRSIKGLSPLKFNLKATLIYQ